MIGRKVYIDQAPHIAKNTDAAKKVLLKLQKVLQAREVLIQ